MRILHVVPSYLPATRYGGTLYSVHGLAKSLVARGHDVEVCTTNVDGNSNSNVPLNQPVDMDGVKVWYFSSNLIRRLYYSTSMKDHLRFTVCKNDIIHLHSVFLWPTLAAARLSYKNNIPYVLSPRGMLVSELIKKKNYLVKSLWINLFEKKSIKRAAGLHVTSAIEAEEIKKLGIDYKEIFTIPNGIDIVDDINYTDQINYELPSRFGLYLGRINWKKGLDRLIHAWSMVDKIDLVIAGNDEENYQPRLEKLARDLGLSSRIHFPGHVKDDYKWGLYKNAELFILPSLSENFGNVVLEAMSMGCPVVVTPGVGLADVVNRKNTGIVTENDPELLSAAINKLVNDPDLARKMGKNGRDETISSFTWDSIAEKMESFYQAVLK